MSEHKIGICPECKVWSGDSSKKPLRKCKFCRRWFCEKHVQPRPAFIPPKRLQRRRIPSAQEKAWQILVDEAESKEDVSHPDFSYTEMRWREVIAEEKRKRMVIGRFLDKIPSPPRWLGISSVKQYQTTEDKEIMESYCPECSSDRIQTTAYRPESSYYECLDCGFKWKQPRLLPKPKPQLPKQTSPPKGNHTGRATYISKQRIQKPKRKRRYRVAVLSLCLLGAILSGVIIYAYGPQVVVWIKTKFPSIQPDQTTEVADYQLVIDVVGSGVTHPSSGSYMYDEGTEVTVDAIPDPGWKLDHWELDGSNVGSAGSQTVTVNANRTIIAFFDRAIEELVNYALSLINIDRTTHGLSNVSLSPIESAQEHAEDMLEHHYLSHWDTDGYKPYMRYTLAGGQGAVAENCAWHYSSGSLDVKEVIKDLEWSMVYDDADSNWGHRDNILDPFHNRVSIGIAYDNHNVYCVQDFEDDYIEWSTFMDINSESEVTLSGSFRVHQLSIESINIFYDAYPTNLTSDQLNSFYSGSYSQGTFVGMALPQNYYSVEGITITAQKWVQTDNYFQIRFDLSQAFDAYDKGVYTLYLQSDSESYHYLTSYSFWNN